MNTKLAPDPTPPPPHLLGPLKRAGLALALTLAMALGSLTPASAFALHKDIEVLAGKRVATHVWSAKQPKTAAGDLNGDGHNDYLYLDPSGRLWLYPGTSVTNYSARVQLASGWGSVNLLLGGVDFDSDGHIDLLTRERDGKLYFHPGRGDGTFASPRLIGTGWGGMHLLTVAQSGVGGKPTVYAANSTGKLRIYPTNGHGTFLPATNRRVIGSGWQNVRMLTAIGDVDANGRSDFVAVLNNGQMRHYSLKENGYSMTISGLDHNWSNMAWIGGINDHVAGFWAAHNNGHLRYYALGTRTTPAPDPDPSPPTRTSMFVYGTLRHGEPAHHLMQGTYHSYTTETMGSTAMYYATNRKFPYLVYGVSGTSTGEVYYLHDATANATIARTDAYERYNPRKPDSGQAYVRKQHLTSTGHPSWVYIAGPEQAAWLKSSGTKIPSGDWLRR